MRNLVLVCFLLVLCGCDSCDKTNGNIGGKGGNATLKVNLKHHYVARNIVIGMVYIKYNSLDKPGNDLYDDSCLLSHAISDTMMTSVFDSLKKGDYYLYGRGYDTSVNENVVGGFHYSIADEITQVFDLAVSE